MSSWVVDECVDKLYLKQEFLNLTLLGVIEASIKNENNLLNYKVSRSKHLRTQQTY